MLDDDTFKYLTNSGFSGGGSPEFLFPEKLVRTPQSVAGHLPEGSNSVLPCSDVYGHVLLKMHNDEA